MDFPPNSFYAELNNMTGGAWVIEVIPYTVFKYGNNYIAHSWDSFQALINNGGAGNLWDIRKNMRNSIKIADSVALPMGWQDMGYTAPPVSYDEGTEGIGIIYPEGAPYDPINFICTDLEAEYLPATNELKVRTQAAVDATKPYAYNGYATNNLTPTNQFGDFSEIQEGSKDNLTAYLPGLTKTYIAVSWGSGTAAQSIRVNDVPLYVENAHQFKNPSSKAAPNPDAEAFYQYREHETMPVGEKVVTTVDRMVNDLQVPNCDSFYDGEDGWVYFKLPKIPANEEFIRITAGVNTYDYQRTPLTNANLNSMHVRPQTGLQFKIRKDGELKAQVPTESWYHDNAKVLTIPLPSFNLKAGGHDEDDQIKLSAAYDTTNGGLCISAPGIFESFGATENTEQDGDGGAQKSETASIATSHNVQIRFTSTGTTSFTNGQTITHKAGDIVNFSDIGLQSFTRYFGGWAYDEATTWTSNVRYFGNDDYPSVTASQGTKPNLREQTKYYDLTDGAESTVPWCTPFPQPTRATKFEIVYTLNPSLDPADGDSTKERIPDGESGYEDNTATTQITLGPEVNFVASEVSGTAEPGTYTERGNADYTKPYTLTVNGYGYLQKLAGLDQLGDSIDTETRIYVAPALPNGDNPFSTYAETTGGCSTKSQ